MEESYPRGHKSCLLWSIPGHRFYIATLQGLFIASPSKEAGKWIIISPDGTWHRPLTTFELAMLRGFRHQ